jgi:hypothetical protein
MMDEIADDFGYDVFHAVGHPIEKLVDHFTGGENDAIAFMTEQTKGVKNIYLML